MKRPPQTRLTTLGLLILRVMLGTIFFANGWQKTIVDGRATTAASFTEMGIPLPDVIGPAIGLLELIGGAGLILGLATRVAALLLAGDMIVAFVTVESAGGFFNSELVLILAASAATIALTGAGRISLDALMPDRLALTTIPKTS